MNVQQRGMSSSETHARLTHFQRLAPLRGIFPGRRILEVKLGAPAPPQHPSDVRYHQRLATIRGKKCAKSSTKPRLITPEIARKYHIYLRIRRKNSTPPGVYYSFCSLF